MLDSYKQMCKKCAPWGMTVLRVIAGVVLIYHGYPKLFGDTEAMLQFFESTALPFPSFMLLLSGVLELFGGALLILGLFTRFVSTVLLIEFLVILLFVKWGADFSQMELELLLFGSLFALSSIGPGKPSVDALMSKKGGEAKDEEADMENSRQGGQGSQAMGG